MHSRFSTNIWVGTPLSELPHDVKKGEFNVERFNMRIPQDIGILRHNDLTEAANPESSHFSLSTKCKADTHIYFKTHFSPLELCLQEPLSDFSFSRSFHQSGSFLTIPDCQFCWGFCSPRVKVSDHSRHVMSSSPVSLKTRRVREQCTLNPSRAQTSTRWCGVVVRRGGASSGVVLVTRPWF
ncbi:hypothetical protein TNCV_2340831 [Trichonephila clavipes]|nr:hypothetical protein TNCV_2340831 [Trichonephila clavipes]